MRVMEQECAGHLRNGTTQSLDGKQTSAKLQCSQSSCYELGSSLEELMGCDQGPWTLLTPEVLVSIVHFGPNSYHQ